MPVKRPSTEQLKQIGEDFGFALSDAELDSFTALISDSFASYDRIDELEEPKLVSNYAREKGNPPALEDNPHNAWVASLVERFCCAMRSNRTFPLMRQPRRRS